MAAQTSSPAAPAYPETRAVLRYSHVSPTKVRQVLGLIRGIDVDEARDRLRFCERGPAEPVRKLLDSAVANAEHNNNLPPDELYVVRAWADEGPTQKRMRPRARGRGVQIRKRTSHVTIVVARYTDEQLELRRRREDSAGGTADARRRASRRRRVKASEPVEEHDHDEHDHEHDASAPTDEATTTTEVVDAEVTEAPEITETAEADATPEASDEPAADTTTNDADDEEETK
jgi:large subunit ribosomal protein L22